MKNQKTWVCWSHKQKCFHIESEDDGCRKNLISFGLNRPSDYIVVGSFDTRKEADTFLDAIQSRRPV